jgi:hypothetical protein
LDALDDLDALGTLEPRDPPLATLFSLIATTPRRGVTRVRVNAEVLVEEIAVSHR